LNNPLDLAMIHRQVMSGYRRIGVDSLIGFLARNGDGGEIFAPATGFGAAQYVIPTVSITLRITY
jgi:hypothetical protein